MKRKYNVVIAFLLTLLMVLGGGVMAFADTPVDGASGTDQTVISSEDQGQKPDLEQGGSLTGPAVDQQDGSLTGPAVELQDESLTGPAVEPQELLLMKENGNKETSIHLKNNSSEGITGVAIYFKDGSFVTLELKGNNWEASDSGERVLDNIKKVTVSFETYGDKDYIYPDDFGPQGGKAEPIEYSAEGNGSGSINLWLNSLPGVENPSISLIKSVSPSSVTSKAAVVTYTFTVTNDGNTDLTDVVLTDPLLNNLNVTIGSLKKDAVYTTSVAFDLGSLKDNAWSGGKFTNTAKVVGAFGDQSVSNTAVATVTYQNPSSPDPKLSIEKKVRLAESGAEYVDDLTVRNNTVPVEYQFTVTNTGNVTLDSVHVNDGILRWTSEAVTLPAGESHTFTTTYAIAVKDWDKNGVFVNTASAAGIFNNETVTADPDDATVIYHDSTTSKAAILLKKEVSTPKVDSKTASVNYTFTIKNIGDIDLFGVRLEDLAIGQPDYPIGNLAAGETTTASIAFNLSLLGTSTYGNWSGDTFTNHATVTGYYEGEEKGNSSVTATSSAIVTYSSGSPGGGGDTGGNGGHKGPRGGNTATIPEEPVPTAPAPVTPETPVILDEAVPAGALPQTGGIDAMILYGLGTLLAGGGFVLRRREKSK